MASACAIIVLLAILSSATAYQAHSLTRTDEQAFPHIVQYIDAFSLGGRDLEKLIANQFRRITIADIATPAYEVHNTSISLKYDGTAKRVEQVSPLEVKVTDDSFTLAVQFQVKVQHAVGGKNYSCSTSIPQLLVSYTKAVDFASGSTLLTRFSSSYSSASFLKPTCKETVAKSDSAPLADAVNSTKNWSLYLQLKKIMDRMQDYLQYNAREERLSRIYDQNPYSYDFYGFKMSLNVSTIEATPYSAEGIQNSISGGIAGSSFPAVDPPAHEQGFSSFYSLELMQGAIEYVANNYAPWREIKLNRNNMRTRLFRWRLIDFEYIVPSVLALNPQSYLAEVDIECGLEEVGEAELEEELKVGINWRCTAGFEGEDKRRLTFLSFLVGLKHSVEFTVQKESLGVRVSRLEMEKLQFDYIGDYQVIDPFTAGEFIKQGLLEFQVFTFGTSFKIHSPALKKKVSPGRGLWIG